jgi:hypothetical protein
MKKRNLQPDFIELDAFALIRSRIKTSAEVKLCRSRYNE